MFPWFAFLATDVLQHVVNARDLWLSKSRANDSSKSVLLGPCYPPSGGVLRALKELGGRLYQQ